MCLSSSPMKEQENNAEDTDSRPHFLSLLPKGLTKLWQRNRDTKTIPTCSPSCKADRTIPRASHETTPLEFMQSVVEGLVLSGSSEFACLCVVYELHGTFGVLAASGLGAELFPSSLGEDEQGPSLLNELPIATSNWSVQDAVETQMPLYYDCGASDAPCEAARLRRAGLQTMLSLPCLHNGAVHGVLTVGIDSTSVDPQLMLKLRELSCSLTPHILAGKQHIRHALPPRPAPCWFESQDDATIALVDELLNLDDILMNRLGPAEHQDSGEPGPAHAYSFCRSVSAPEVTLTQAISCVVPSTRSTSPRLQVSVISTRLSKDQECNEGCMTSSDATNLPSATGIAMVSETRNLAHDSASSQGPARKRTDGLCAKEQVMMACSPCESVRSFSRAASTCQIVVSGPTAPPNAYLVCAVPAS